MKGQAQSQIRPPLAQAIGILAAILLTQALILFLMGRPPICPCGTIRLFQADVLSPESSQQIFDWYSPSHVIHGIIFFFAIKLFFPRLPPLAGFALALGVEIGWEILENSPPIIARYRQQALAGAYAGDSILNSLSDVLAMTLGFTLARMLSFKVTLALSVSLELLTLAIIRDNLTLNILQLVYPIEAISRWQAG